MSDIDRDRVLRGLAAFNAQLEAEKQRDKEAALWRTFAEFQPEQAAAFVAACTFKQESANGR